MLFAYNALSYIAH